MQQGSKEGHTVGLRYWLTLNWLRVFRSAGASRIGQGGRQPLHTSAVRSEKCVGLRGKAWSGMRVIAAFFSPCAPYALTAHVSVFSHSFKRLDRLAKLATSSIRKSQKRGFPDMLVGSMRVSSENDRQTTDLQRDALLDAGVNPRHLFADKASGARDDRPGLQQALAYVRPGDCLIVWKLDRLGRSLSHLLHIVTTLGTLQN